MSKKIYKKSECKVSHGRIVHKGKVLGITWAVHNQLGLLEGMYQKALYNRNLPQQAEVQPFARKHKGYRPAAPLTPALDAKAAEGVKLAQELDRQDQYQRKLRLAERFEDLVAWVDDEAIVDCDDVHELPDLYYLEDELLEMDVIQLYVYLQIIVEQDVDKEVFPDPHVMRGCKELF